MKFPDRYELLEYAPADYFQPAQLADIFPGRTRFPTELDLGSGDGGFLLAMASHHSNRNFLGVERLLGRVRKTARQALRLDLPNVRVLRLDSDYAVHWLLPAGSFTRIHFLFPDPWPKHRHHRRRQFQPDFLRAIHRLLTPGGEFLFKTDHQDYFQHASVVAASAACPLEPSPWLPGDFFYPETDFEKQWRAEGRQIWQLRLRKTP